MYYVSKVYKDENRSIISDILLSNKHPKYKGKYGVNGILYDLKRKRFYILKNNICQDFDKNGKDILGMFSLLKKIGFTISNKVLDRYINMINSVEKLNE